MPDASSHPTPTALVGRLRERTTLHEHLDAALAGRGALILIGGEAGIGKTALAEQLCAEARARGALVLIGRCYDLAETPPYGPWRELRTTYPTTPDLPPMPPSFSAAANDGRTTGASSQDALFTQARDFLVSVAATRPLVLLLDDLHWADPASLDLLRFLGRQLSAHRLLILATYRADELTRHQPLYTLLPTLVRETQATRLDLRPLTRDDLAALVAARYPLPEPDAKRLVSHLNYYAEGNPFYVGELLRALEDEGLLYSAGGDSWRVSELRDARVPPLVHQLIDVRLVRLGGEAVRLLGIAALIGPVVLPDIWAAVAETSEDALLDTIERAVEARVLAESVAEGGYRFTHALIRGVLYQGILLPRRRAWHRRIAETLAATPTPEPERVAHHFRRANDPRAAEWLIRAGEQAQATYAWLTAAERFEAALALLTIQGVERAMVLATLAQLRRYSDPHRGIEQLEEAAHLAEEEGDHVLAAACRFDQGQLRCLAFDMRRGLAQMLAALPLLEALPESDRHRLPTPRLLRLAPGAQHFRGAFVVQLANAGRLAEARDYGAGILAREPGTTGRGLLGLGLVHAELGQPALARQAYADARAAFRSTGEQVEIVRTLAYEINSTLWPYYTDQPGLWRASMAEAERAIQHAIGAQPSLGARLTALPFLLLAGEWSDSREFDAGNDNPNMWTRASLARYQGDPSLVWSVVTRVFPLGPATEPGESHHLFEVMPLQHLAVALALDAGDLETARSWLAMHDRWLDWTGADQGKSAGQRTWAEYHRAAGNLAAARDHAERALDHAAEPRQPLDLLLAHRLLGELDTIAGRHDDATNHLTAALALADACAAPYERALTLLALAEHHLARGDRVASVTTLAEARALLEPLAARPALTRADALASRLTADTPTIATPSLPAGLSAREAEVLRLVAQGLSNAQAADRLSLSPRTIDQHLRSIYNKLAVENRAAATRFAIEHGLA